MACFKTVHGVSKKVSSNWGKWDMLFPLTGLLQCFLGGFLSCWLPASSAMSGLTLSMYLGYPSLIPGSGDGVRKAYFVLTEQFF